MTSIEQQMYIRCKRRNQTYFIHVSKADTFGALKGRISEATNGEIEAQDMKLFLNEKELSDGGTVADHEVANNAVIGVTFGGEDLVIDDVTAE